MVLGEQALPVRSELAVDDARNVMRLPRSSVLMERPTAEFGTSTMASTSSTSSHLRAMALPTSALFWGGASTMAALIFLPPPLKSSAAIRAASTDPMPLVSWKMPEMSLSTPTRTTSPEISACAGAEVTNDNASAMQGRRLFIFLSLSDLFIRKPQHQTIEVVRPLNLAGQAAVAQPRGRRAIQ